MCLLLNPILCSYTQNREENVYLICHIIDLHFFKYLKTIFVSLHPLPLCQLSLHSHLSQGFIFIILKKIVSTEIHHYLCTFISMNISFSTFIYGTQTDFNWTDFFNPYYLEMTYLFAMVSHILSLSHFYFFSLYPVHSWNCISLTVIHEVNELACFFKPSWDVQSFTVAYFKTGTFNK